MQITEHKYMPVFRHSFQKRSQGSVIFEAPLVSLPTTNWTILISFFKLQNFYMYKLFFFFSFLILLRLTVHVSPSGTACYITSMMFYVEIQLQKDGDVMDVKLAHFEEAPVVKLIFSVSHNPVVSHLASSCHVRKVLTSFWSCHTCKPVHDTSYL